MRKVPRVKPKISITPHPEWARKFWEELVPLKDRIVHHPCFQEMSAGTLSLERFRRGLVGFYPLVENFPKFMALNLTKTLSGIAPGHIDAKYWLIENIAVEQTHADWWCHWAQGFGCSLEELPKTTPSPFMDAINHYLWHINTYGSLAEGLGATNIAVEWATGEWTGRVLNGVRSYAADEDIEISERTMAWLEAHAEYDDHHGHEAMELVKLCATTPEEQRKAFLATKRGIEYYLAALDDCYEPFKLGLLCHT